MALKLFASRDSGRAEVTISPTLAEYFSGSKDAWRNGEWTEGNGQRGDGNESEKNVKWQSVREHWGLTRTLDNARYFALQRQQRTPVVARLGEICRYGEE